MIETSFRAPDSKFLNFDLLEDSKVNKLPILVIKRYKLIGEFLGVPYRTISILATVDSAAAQRRHRVKIVHVTAKRGFEPTLTDMVCSDE